MIDEELRMVLCVFPPKLILSCWGEDLFPVVQDENLSCPGRREIDSRTTARSVRRRRRLVGFSVLLQHPGQHADGGCCRFADNEARQNRADQWHLRGLLNRRRCH